MRVVAIVVALTANLLGAPTLAAESGGCRTKTLFTDTGRAYQVEVCEGSGGSARPAAGRSRASGRRYQPSELVRVVSSVEGAECSMWATRTSVQGRRALAVRTDAAISGDIFGTSVWEVWQDMVAALPACGARAGDPAEQSVFGFLYEYGTPDPEPWIAPGFAITGKRAYLETWGPLSHRPEPVETPSGRLEVVFAATSFTVDWGDGTAPEEYASPGEPWPDGEASHVYVDMGVYDVVVAQRWQASWRLGDRAGEVILTGAPSVIDAFEVGQLQAVRDR